MIQSSSWGMDTAEAYKEFCDSHTLYSDTSDALAKFSSRLLSARFPADKPLKAVDLGCGTGESTRCILSQIPIERIWGIDMADAMLKVASENFIDDKRVEFICGSGNKLSNLITEKVDIIICNASFWLMNMPQVFNEAQRVLSENGVLCFNIPGYMVEHDQGDQGSKNAPPLMSAFADEIKNVSGANQLNTSYSLRESTLMRVAGLRGMSLIDQETITLTEPLECSYDSLCIPAIFDAYRGNTDKQTAQNILDTLFQQLTDQPPGEVNWHNFGFAKL